MFAEYRAIKGVNATYKLFCPHVTSHAGLILASAYFYDGMSMSVYGLRFRAIWTSLVQVEHRIKGQLNQKRSRSQELGLSSSEKKKLQKTSTVRNESSWQRNVRKILKACGEEHVNSVKNVVAKRTVGALYMYMYLLAG